MKMSLREMRGLAILAIGGQIKKVNDETFIVNSQSTPRIQRRVKWDGKGWKCDCPDYRKRKKPCKHIYAVNFLLSLPKILISNSEAFYRTCPYCGSADTQPKGYRYNKSGAVKMWRCKKCKRKFKDPLLNEHAGARAGLMVIALDLYFKGLSLREIENHIWQVYNISISTSTVHRWVTKILRKFNEALSHEKLEVGDKWLADETTIKVCGKANYLWNIIDYETRHHIVSLLSEGRGAEEALKAIKEAIVNAGKPPKKLVTDGLKSYAKALEHLKDLSIEHISNVGLTKKENNNRIERLHGTIKEWTKGKRNLKNPKLARELLQGFRLYYNFVRPNQALPEQGRRKKLTSILLQQ